MSDPKNRIQVRGVGSNRLLFVLLRDTLEIEIKVGSNTYLVKVNDMLAFASSSVDRTTLRAPIKFNAPPEDTESDVLAD